MTQPRHLDEQTKRALEPLARLVYDASGILRTLSDADLERVIRAADAVSTINCSWADYEVARWSWIQREAKYVQAERAKKAAPAA